MPIIGKTDLQGFAGANLPELGKLRKGAAKTERTRNDGTKYEVVGADLDFFRVDWHPQYEVYNPIFVQLYGETPAEFRNVTLMGTTPEEVFPNWLEERTPTKLIHQCDGQTQHMRYDETGYKRDGAPCVKLSGGKCNCTERGRLKVLLTDFIHESGVWGYFSVETGSLHDILNIDGYLKFMSGFQGSLQGLYFVLGRAPREISVPDPKKSGSRIRTTKHLLYLMIEPDMSKNLLMNRFHHQNQLIASGQLTPSTGELQAGASLQIAATAAPPLEIDVVPVLSYDLERVFDLTSHWFNDPVHQMNLVTKLQNDGTITNGMDDEQVMAAISQNRKERAAQQLDDGTWWANETMVREFLAVLNISTNLTPNAIMNALNALYDKPKQNWRQFKGLSKAKATAACLYSAYYDEEAIKRAADDPDVAAALAEIMGADAYPPDVKF